MVGAKGHIATEIARQQANQLVSQLSRVGLEFLILLLYQRGLASEIWLIDTLHFVLLVKSYFIGLSHISRVFCSLLTLCSPRILHAI